MSRCRIFLGVFLLPFLLTGCLGLVSTTAPRYYEIDPLFIPVECAQPTERTLRVWHFGASAPFDREQMIVLAEGKEVKFSSEYRWVALPGTLLADQLIHDLSTDRFFQKVVSPGDPFSTSTEMGGHVFAFGLEQSEKTAKAILEVEVTVWENRPEETLAERRILFRKSYRLESEPSPTGDSDFLARAISRLVGDFSGLLRQDLCLMGL
jgi:ABC-type uncharacterized transport system auxiliary subunit